MIVRQLFCLFNDNMMFGCVVHYYHVRNFAMIAGMINNNKVGPY